MVNMKYLLNRISFISLMILFSFFDNFGMKEEEEEKKEFKVVFVGDTNVGKTQIINKFVKKSFEENAPSTTSAYFYTKEIEYNGKKIKLEMWDTSGHEKYKSLAKIFCVNSHLIVFVYAIDNEESFNNIKSWVEQVKAKTAEKTKFLLVGNKCDLEDKRQVSIQEGKDCAEAENMKFIEVSAKTGKNIENIFDSIIQEILDDMKKEKIFYDNKYNNIHYFEQNNTNNLDLSSLVSSEQSIDIIKNQKTSFCNKYCYCCHCL